MKIMTTIMKNMKDSMEKCIKNIKESDKYTKIIVAMSIISLLMIIS